MKDAHDFVEGALATACGHVPVTVQFPVCAYAHQQTVITAA